MSEDKAEIVKIGNLVHRIVELENALHMGLGAVGPLKDVTPLLRERFAPFVEAAYSILTSPTLIVHATRMMRGVSNGRNCPMWSYYDVPGHWPKGHRFSDDRKDVTCEACRLDFPEMDDVEGRLPCGHLNRVICSAAMCDGSPKLWHEANPEKP
jgi:hypothetical protein